MRKLIIFLWAFFFGVSICQAKPIDRGYLSKEIRETLKDAGYYTPDLHKIILGTIASESDFGRIDKQVGGPALGLVQMEPATHKDLWENWIEYRPSIKKKVEKTLWFGVPKLVQLRYNLRYQIIMTAVHYRRANAQDKCLEHPKFKTKADEVWYYAWLHKKKFNTEKGKGTTTRFFQKYYEYVYRGP